MKSIRPLLFSLLLLAVPLAAASQPPAPAPAPEQKPPDEQLKDKQKREQEPEDNASEMQKEQKEGGKGAPKEISEKKEDKWDVNNPPGPSSEVAIDVNEGTWMSVDVSPDGKEIVFDLLGDLYTVPIGGGEAKALTHDVAWEMQPRYSPDGKSHRLHQRPGGRRQRLGDEPRRLEPDGRSPRRPSGCSTSPDWSPDGEFIVARKHFTAQRSLGAGEMWLYHRSGGDGLQLTKKPNDQKDVGEPAFSPDGRYLYYSQDTTPGPVFEYNKDPNAEIYAIQRLDRRDRRDRGATSPARAARSGRRRRRTARRSPSSAACATRACSPPGPRVRARAGRSTTVSTATCRRPGRSTASIPACRGRRTRARSSSGPAARSAASTRRARQVSDIPFHVKTTRAVTEAVRFPVEVAPKTFDTKMLRWVDVAPNGRPGGLPGPGLPLGARPAGRHAAAPDQAERPLGVLPLLLARRPADRLHHLGRRQARHRAGGPGGRRRGPGGGLDARALRRARLHARRPGDRLPQDRGRLPAHRLLVARTRASTGWRRRAATRSWSRRTARARTSAPRTTGSTCSASRAKGSGSWSRSASTGEDEREHLTSENATEFSRLSGRQVGGLHASASRPT